jgi:hypothetical protein
LRASPRRAALEPAFAGLARHDLREPHPDSHTAGTSRLGVREAVDLLDDSPTLRHESLGLAGDELANPADRTATVPANKRFAAWSRRYLMLVAGADALVGGVAAVVPASISETVSGRNYAVPLLCLVGLLVWPVAIALCRGYRRNRIGIGLDEPGAVIRAGMVVVVAGALPAGFMAVPTGALNPVGALTLYALLKLVATATPFAVCSALWFGSSPEKAGISCRAMDVASGTSLWSAALGRRSSSASGFSGRLVRSSAKCLARRAGGHWSPPD